MALMLDGGGVMDHLWDQLEKTEDGNHVYYTNLDIITLWETGFVDTERYDIETWKQVFEPYKQDEDAYLLNKDEFLKLDDYRFKGEIHIPFDAMLINEGKYTDEGLDELVELSIVPSCKMSQDQLYSFFATLKEDFRDTDGLIIIKEDAKQRIKTLLESNPSPLRNLEILLDQMYESKGADLESEIDKLESDVATLEAARQVSQFSASPTTKVEAKAKQFEKLQKVKKKKEFVEEDDGKDKVKLKKIKRSRKGFRG
ncbi:MAG: hypothetical protein HN337_04400 [Deltaproteobacteria bacterium]|jgi:hypothetical protein|nr:hypothetical protein [Deltaproteobacteria bacterium]